MLRNVSSATKNLLQRFPVTVISKNSNVRYSTQDEPVKFSASKASEWKASYTRSGVEGENEAAWFQPYVVSFSVAIFLIYFCILREENDIDEKLGISLYDRIDGLEESQLKTILAYNQEHDKDTYDIKKRIKELEEKKQSNI